MSHPIPEGHRTLTPHLIIKGADEAIEFYQRAFGAEVLCRMPMPTSDGTTRLAHAALRIGDSMLFLADECPEYGSMGPEGNTPVTMHMFVTDADAAFNKAVEAGASVTMPLADMFWGDRYGKVVDPYGHHWSIAEHLEDLTGEQMQERMAAAFSMEPSGAK